MVPLEPRDPAAAVDGGAALRRRCCSLLCIPTLSLRLGTNDAGTDPAGTTTREAYDLLAEASGPASTAPS